MTTATDVDVELDQQTRDQLQPPCECRTYSVFLGMLVAEIGRCESAATTIVRGHCPCRAGVYLMCDPHSIDASAGRMTCPNCNTPICVITTDRI